MLFLVENNICVVSDPTQYSVQRHNLVFTDNLVLCGEVFSRISIREQHFLLENKQNVLAKQHYVWAIWHSEWAEKQNGLPTGTKWGSVTICLVRSGLVRSGQVWSVLVSSVQVWSVLVRSGQIWSGLVRSGQVWSGLVR